LGASTSGASTLGASTLGASTSGASTSGSGDTSGTSDANAKKRTLTNLYNQRPTWLELAHKRLDQAVFAAYGWKSDLSDEEILEKLLSLNLERSNGK
jgi:hypothetical protein